MQVTLHATTTHLLSPSSAALMLLLLLLAAVARASCGQMSVVAPSAWRRRRPGLGGAKRTKPATACIRPPKRTCSSGWARAMNPVRDRQCRRLLPSGRGSACACMARGSRPAALAGLPGATAPDGLPCVNDATLLALACMAKAPMAAVDRGSRQASPPGRAQRPIPSILKTRSLNWWQHSTLFAACEGQQVAAGRVLRSRASS